ncbi:MAG: response regulator transcription factor, partial [Planctomycetales bacterium]
TVDKATSTPAMAKAKKPDLILMDTIIPGSDPFPAGAKILKGSPTTKLVYYCDMCSDNMLDQAIEVGASGFIAKSESPERLVLGLRQIAEGETYFSPEMERRLVKTRGLRPRSRLSTLSPREREVLRHLAEDYSVQDTAKILGVAPTTVETHRQSIRAKLDIRGAAGMARFAIREGLMEA